MTKDEQARQRLVEIALGCASTTYPVSNSLCLADEVRRRAGFRNPTTGSWCAAGLTAAMEDAGLLVPAPGTPARRGACALVDFIALDTDSESAWTKYGDSPAQVLASWEAQPGDIIAWLQHPQPDPAGWRRGHVAVIVATDTESITTVGWNEGASPGRVMMRRLWRDPERFCDHCGGTGVVWRRGKQDARLYTRCPVCKQVRRGARRTAVLRSSTVLWRRPGGIYGIARPVAA